MSDLMSDLHLAKTPTLPMSAAFFLSVYADDAFTSAIGGQFLLPVRPPFRQYQQNFINRVSPFVPTAFQQTNTPMFIIPGGFSSSGFGVTPPLSVHSQYAFAGNIPLRIPPSAIHIPLNPLFPLLMAPTPGVPEGSFGSQGLKLRKFTPKFKMLYTSFLGHLNELLKRYIEQTHLTPMRNLHQNEKAIDNNKKKRTNI
ncbi:hypothetical protein Anas_07948 [Armadillidium nasatum]|uniref:Uncharacterized protein n=1 Tax=Armadillidium nasatum TaxID=96803 RepID=A0A5N5SR75_9CRUS|nr:hypothetical protein Anas_07948 [Armadillidium nasatum]